jgi:hypothetical protein
MAQESKGIFGDVKTRAPKAGIQLVETIGSGVAVNALTRTMGKVKEGEDPAKASNRAKMVGYGALGLGILCSLTKNEHLQNVGLGLAVSGSYNLLAIHSKDDGVTAPSSTKKMLSMLAPINGLDSEVEDYEMNVNQFAALPSMMVADEDAEMENDYQMEGVYEGIPAELDFA